MKVVSGGVTKARGFKANGIWCGIKRKKPDLALIYSTCPAAAAGVFTKNSVVAAPLTVTKSHLKNGKARAIVCNSGNANCFTGKFGLMYAHQTAQLFAELLQVDIKDVLISSTGIIGKALPFHKIEDGAEKLVKGLSTEGAHKCARAILTTDLDTKEIAVTTTVGGKRITIGGCAKGAGMVAPNMATMLGFITTDVSIQPRLLKTALKEATEESFNCITVDGCMSTNDMVVVLANGCAGNKTIRSKGKDYQNFLKALKYVCLELAKKIVLDAEGSSKFIQIEVSGAKTKSQAKAVGLAVGNSMLVKTAAFGSNPNWGRVAQAVGALGIKGIHEETLKISFSPFDRKEITIRVDLSLGKDNCTVFSSDLSYEYIKINGEYN